MHIVYYSGALTGSGHVIQGISIYNALVRNRIDARYTILEGSKFSFLAEQYSIPHVHIPGENEYSLSEKNYKESELYNRLIDLEPDILIVDLTWFTLHYFIDELDCKKIILFRRLSPDGFRFPLLEPPIEFQPNQYNYVIATEPFQHTLEMYEINPIIIRNRDEIYSEIEAKGKLGVSPDSKCCLFALNGKPGEFEEYKKMYSYLPDEGYTMIYSTNYNDGLFPAVDYFNAFDLIISGGGYNSFWETRFFKKEAVHIPFFRRFENQELRIAHFSDYCFEQNGADQLVKLLSRQ